MKWSAWLRKQHAVISYFMLIPFLWITVTGTLLSALTFWKEASEPFHLPSARFSYSGITPLNQLNQVLAGAELSSRAADLTRVEFSDDEGKSLRARFDKNEQWFFAPAATEPYAKLQGRTRLDQLISTITNLHRGRFADLPGQIVFSLISLILIALCLTGIFLFKRRKVEATARSFHSWIAIVVAAPLLILFATGGVGNLSNQLRGTATSSKGASPVSILGMSWRSALEQAQATRVNAVVDGLFKVKTGLMAEFSDGGRIYFSVQDDGQDQISSIYLPWTLKGWLEPWYILHTGRVAGLLGRIVMGAAGLLSIALFSAGLFLLSQRPFFRKLKKRFS